MDSISRRGFTEKALKGGGALAVLTVLALPEKAMANKMKFSLKNERFLNRNDLSDALKSLYTTYDSTAPYPHKFNETITKAVLSALDFCIPLGIEKDYVDHYITTMAPVFKGIKLSVEKDGPEKALRGLFEETTTSYQLFERINVKPGERSFPCPYKGKLDDCKEWIGKYNGTFKYEWKDVCNKWCVPAWNGAAKEIGVKLEIIPGEECRVKLA